ncbi:MAG: LysR substrate-binding domain-containing protein [Hyphomicrobiales bacterium]
MTLNLRALRCFLAVAEELHFGRAAKRLNISQPPLTQHIKGLEHELGARLFNRTKRSVQITDAGAALVDEARLLLTQADGLRHVVQRADSGRGGSLRAGFITSAVFTKTRLLYIRMSGVPGATVLWQEMNSSEQVEALREGRIDIGFLHSPSEHADLESRVIVRDPMVVAVPETHRLAGRKSAPLSEFGKDDFVLPLRHMSPAFYDRILAACSAAGISPAVPHQPRHLLTILSMVSMGAGISLVPASLASAGFPSVSFIKIRGPAPVTEVSVVWNPANRSPVLARALKVLGLAP